jgi:hypothetical protein
MPFQETLAVLLRGHSCKHVLHRHISFVRREPSDKPLVSFELKKKGKKKKKIRRTLQQKKKLGQFKTKALAQATHLMSFTAAALRTDTTASVLFAFTASTLDWHN